MIVIMKDNWYSIYTYIFQNTIIIEYIFHNNSTINEGYLFIRLFWLGYYKLYISNIKPYIYFKIYQYHIWYF